MRKSAGSVRGGLSPRVRGNPGCRPFGHSNGGSIPACAGEPSLQERQWNGPQVYPRVCGGTPAGETPAGPKSGLSPRVRGNPPRRPPPLLRPGSIPACAGEPRCSRMMRQRGEVYPRVCGGTSPRVRGNPELGITPQTITRNLPACAGEPGGSAVGGFAPGEPPRVCGGTPPEISCPAAVSGTSPRVRGNQVASSASAAGRRNLPACAGEPRRAWDVARQNEEPPRVCGGTASARPVSCASQGTSPRVRGNRDIFCAQHRRSRNLPACAGEPRRIPAARSARREPPRVCGGTLYPELASRIERGTSPRVRGNHKGSSVVEGEWRNLPACAGEPAPAPPAQGPVPEPPRVCGGTPERHTRARPAGGTSPRVRGNPPVSRTARPDTRNLPACAGEPSGAREKNIPSKEPPRVCGGTPTNCWIWWAARGTSPRVRGNPWSTALGDATVRNLPACAGEPGLAGGNLCRPTEPPRVCGGTSATNSNPVAPAGTSPRVRGNLSNGRPATVNRRNLPACAGEPIILAFGIEAVREPPRVCGGTGADRMAHQSDCGTSPRVRGNPAQSGIAAAGEGNLPACAGEPFSYNTPTKA